ncbi:MAG: putative DNA modification/repair radical SAM protein, partial [Bacteriovorax sp.]|nr:putative DNA modification/repair radical SAM protein [Bacteriovorax sp.]
MELKTKISILADAAKYDASCASSGSKRKAIQGGIGNLEGSGICHSYTPDGRCISLLKILLTNFCIYDCSYCVNRISSQVKRAKFTVEEIVNLTMNFYKRNYIEGLFLSSGVAKSSDETMEEMIEVARRLRVDHKFGGYIHLKAVAGCSESLLLKAGLYADRLSANIELPKQKDLNDLAPAKTHIEIEKSMEQIQERMTENAEERKLFKLAPQFSPSGQSTQMIIGATKSSDRDIMTKASDLYGNFNLKRVYYSAFSPIPDSDPNLPSQRPPMLREHRLYQTDWLLRFYGFDINEVLPQDVPELDLDMDPKLSWAIRNRKNFPVDLNVAPKNILLRIPGLGARLVDKILAHRKFQKIRLTDLSKMRV